MFKSFRIAFSLKNTYRANSIIYSIRQLPIIGKRLPVQLYGSEAIKTVANAISILWEFGSTFLGKAIYLLLLVLLPAYMYDMADGAIFIHILVFLSIIGAYLNTFMFNPSNDKYYAMILMRMDARKYALSNYFYQLLKAAVGFWVMLFLIAGLSGKVSWPVLLVFPIFIIGTKLLITVYGLKRYQRTKEPMNDNFPMKTVWVLTVIFLVVAYGLPAFGIWIPEMAFWICTVAAVLFSIYAICYIWKFKQYQEMYKLLLVKNQTGMDELVTKTIREQNQKYISQDKNIFSNKEGFEYFNELFIKRHKRILWKSTLRVAIVVLFIVLGICAFLILNVEGRGEINKLLMVFLPYFVYIMYWVNRGAIFTQALFMNCDHCMLTYSFYKKPEFILKLFQIRLREIIKVNLVPAVVIAIGLPTFLWLSGGTDNVWNYVLLFVSIISMSIFFSVHYLTCYYLLQPYNAKTEMRSSTYRIVMSVTYIVCFLCINARINIFIFGICVIAFCILYCVIACVLIYKFANKTFRIRN